MDWYPWGAEAFARAKETSRPILLDIGAVWCHWCHVMDHGTYEDARVLKLLAEKFVCVKVDRDERPDVDARYQKSVGALTGQGGWPLTAFLTSEGRVFHGGTYFPADDAHGRPGFVSVLEQIASVYKDQRDKVEESAVHIADAVAGRAHGHAQAEKQPGTTELSPQMVDAVVAGIRRLHDPANGGFGQAPKFPHAGAVMLALTVGELKEDEGLQELAFTTLRKMARGGIHDQLVGGFHRYSVDAHWTVPHFEKMAYDNAELLRAYARAYALTEDADFARVANGIIDWTLEVLGDPENGGFGGSQDADIGPDDDGDHFTWSLDEIRAAIAAAPPLATPSAGSAGAGPSDPDFLFDVARLRFGVEEHGDMHHDDSKNVLEDVRSPQEVAKELGRQEADVIAADTEVRRLMRAARVMRPVPFIDRTRYTEWSAMYASAFLEAGAFLDREDATRHALRTIDRLDADAWDPAHGWAHRPRSEAVVEGMLDDQAWMGLALVDAARFGARHDLLVRAGETADTLLAHWRTEGEAGLTDTALWARENAEAAPLSEPSRPYMDQSGPGGNAVAALFLMRLGRFVHRPELVEAAHDILQSFAGEAPRMGLYAATWAQAVEEWYADPPLVTVFGAADDSMTDDLAELVRSTTRPGVLCTVVHPGETDAAPGFLGEVLGNEDLIKEGASALICHGDHCEALVRDPALLVERLLGKPPSA